MTNIIEPQTLRARAESLHNLICDMLRGPHIEDMPPDQLARFTTRAGIALHNLPMAMVSPTGAVHTSVLSEINALDPDAQQGQWGHWATDLADGFGVALPPSP